MISILCRVLRETPEFSYNLFIQHTGTDSMIGDIMEKETPVEEKLTEKDCSFRGSLFSCGQPFSQVAKPDKLLYNEDKTEGD